jgi:predicted glycosyltransferase
LESMKFLFKLLDEDDSIVLIIRPHPAEKPEDYILPESHLDRVHFASYNSLNLNSSLHDLLLISDLAIVFGSTVALDAKWMGVPCISFETREKSLIYCADNDKIKHVTTIEDFSSLVKSSLHKKSVYEEKRRTSVSDFVLNEIINNN